MQMVGHPPEWNPESAKAGKYDSELKAGMQIHEGDSATGLNKQKDTRQEIPYAGRAKQPSQTIQSLTLLWCDRAHSDAQRPKLSDPAHGTLRLQPRRPRRVRCSAWLGGNIVIN